MSNPFQPIEKKDRSQTKDFIELVDAYNDLVHNTNIIYGLIEDDVEGFNDYLRDPTTGGLIIEDVVNEFLGDELDSAIADALEEILPNKLASDIASALDAAKMEILNDVNGILNAFENNITLQMNNLKNSLENQMSVIQGNINALNSNINQIVTNAFKSNYEDTVIDLVNEAADERFSNYVRQIPTIKPVGAEMQQGSIWLEIS